jgi:WD40 repeat protein
MLITTHNGSTADLRYFRESLRRYSPMVGRDKNFPCHAAAFSPDSRYLATTDGSGRIYAWIVEGTPRPAGDMHAHKGAVLSVSFSSDANRQRFAASPEAFSPQYGGYCSNQMSLGNLSDIDTEVWRIIDSKLYMFGHESGRVRWAGETGRRISDADQHWRTYLAR